MSDTRGLHDKFTVKRNDGRDVPGEKHEGCRYYVLDLTHDEVAREVLPILAAHYLNAGRPQLANDLWDLSFEFEHGPEVSS